MSKRTKVVIALSIISIIVGSLIGTITSRIDKQRVLGVWYFGDDITEIENIIIYDYMGNQLESYSDNMVNDILSEYVDTENVSFRTYPKYKKEFKKYLGELLYTVEVVFPEDRHENKSDRDILVDENVEILTIYALNIELFKEQTDYESYAININGQECVVVLRNILLPVGCVKY